MIILAASDSYKGCLTSRQVGEAVRRGVARISRAQVHILPLADGGEGTVEALTAGLGGQYVDLTVTGPLGAPVAARYGIVPGKRAVIEIAAAAGLPLVPPARRDPMRATTYGVGELIAHAVGRGVRDFIIGLGGSATNDGGMGLLQALGFRFLDAEGRMVVPCAGGLHNLVSLDCSTALPALRACRFTIACDVRNPLCGAQGASAVFAPQKGATPQMAAQLDRLLARYAALCEKTLGVTAQQIPGAGAAGGLGFAFLAFLGGTLRPGAELIAEAVGLEDAIACADLVVTGEGRLDGQTAMGKGPGLVARLAQKHHKPCVALAGSLGSGAERALAAGITAYCAVTPADMPPALYMRPSVASDNIAAAAAQILRRFLPEYKEEPSL